MTDQNIPVPQPSYGSVPPQAPAAAPVPPAAPYTAAPPQASYAPGYAPQQAAAPRKSTLPTTLAHTNTFALIAIITAFIQPIAGIVFGHMALSQIKRNGDAGRGIALTGLILGYVYLAVIVLFVFIYISIIILVISSAGAAFSNMNGYYPNSY